jgi:protoporphyrinogen oxidase
MATYPNGHIVILGAGPCGLGAAYRLRELGRQDWLLFERNDHVGGLSASFSDNKGFTWDIGGHVLFSHYDYFDTVVNSALGGEYYEHLRESWIRLLRTWVPYPFQNNIRHLPEDARRECLEGLNTRSADPHGAKHFHDWMKAMFGPGIVKYFMEPYNIKVWGVPLESMSTKWIGERVSVVDRGRIERNIDKGRDDVSWGPNNKFRFPKRGGTGAIFEGISRPFKCHHIVFNKEAIRIDLHRKEICFADGETIGYDVLINTSPLDMFIRSCSAVPDAVRQAANDLVHNSGLMVGLGFSGARIDPKSWMYFPEDTALFYRVTNFHNYSPYNVSQGSVDRYYSLICETSYSDYKRVDKGTIIQETVAGLVNSGIIGDDEKKSVVSSYLIDVPHSYPVPTLGRDNALKIIRPYLESCDVYSRGRFGAWKYEVGNMDHSFMQGVEVVDRILDGKKEDVVGN